MPASAGWSTNGGRRPHTVTAVVRQCSRTGCSERAEVTLTYDYGGAQAWLDELSSERDPHAYDLCARHAARMTPPRNWQLRDRRLEHRPAALIAV